MPKIIPVLTLGTDVLPPRPETKTDYHTYPHDLTQYSSDNIKKVNSSIERQQLLQNALAALRSGLQKKYLTGEEVSLLKSEFGEDWFETKKNH